MPRTKTMAKPRSAMVAPEVTSANSRTNARSRREWIGGIASIWAMTATEAKWITPELE